MNIRTSLAAVFLGCAVAATTCPALATELKEGKAHVIVDVPNEWNLSVDGEWAMAAPKDNSFHLRVIGHEHGELENAEAERFIVGFVERHLKDVKISDHAKRVDHNNFRGWEIFGTGREKDGAPARFFALVLHDKKNPSKGVVVIGTGTDKGFEHHQPGIHEALKTMRTY